MSEDRQVFTLKQVAASIRKTIEQRYHAVYWVKAEMHKLNVYPSGHAFPELVYKEDDRIVAQMSGTIWKDNLRKINQQFIDVVKEPLKEGNTLLLLVKIVYNEMFGFSLHILDIDPQFSLGELQKEREQTLKKLAKEGLINANQQLEFPLLPKRIAVISADTSKGLSDFMKVLNNNQWNYKFFTMLFPAYLQGDVAVGSIISRLEQIKRVRAHFDLVVIVRGGGGEVGLSCYNNYELCKAIATFPLPVLTGIGHSTNLTVAEMVAFRNAITPTELGGFLIQAFHDFSIPVHEAAEFIHRQARQIMDQTRQQFTAELKLFKGNAKLFLTKASSGLFQSSQQFRHEAKTLITREREFTLQEQRLLIKNAGKYTDRHYEFLADYRLKIRAQAPPVLQKAKTDLVNAENMVRVLDPVQILKRGFSITTVNGKTIKPEMKLQSGDVIQTRTDLLEINSTIESIKEHGK